MNELPLPLWNEPRPVEEWLWMEIQIFDAEGCLVREGRVTWNKDGTGFYEVSITYQDHRGLGLYCWPAFSVLSAAQDFVEQLMRMSPEEAMSIHGTQWPNVVIGRRA